jgi:abortive infection bacteriophage resistance protein
LRPIIAKSFGWDSSKNNRLFAYFLVMRQLSEKATWEEFINSIEESEKHSQFFDLYDYGFPVNWRSFLI